MQAAVVSKKTKRKSDAAFVSKKQEPKKQHGCSCYAQDRTQGCCCYVHKNKTQTAKKNKTQTAKMLLLLKDKRQTNTAMLLLFPIVPTVLLSFAKRLKTVSARVAALSSVLAPLCNRYSERE